MRHGTAALFALLLAACSPAKQMSDTKYFSEISGVISPFLDYNLYGLLSADEAKKINHYRVKYDDQGRVSAIAHFNRDKPSSNAYFRAHEVRYTYDDTVKTRSYFDENGAPTRMWRHYYQSQNVHKEVYKQDGKQTILQMFGTEGDRVSVGTEAYEFRSDRLSDDRYIQTQFKEDGSSASLMPSFLFETVVISVDEHGFLDAVTNWDSEMAQPVDHPVHNYARMQLSFDSYGNEIGWEYRKASGAMHIDADDQYARIVYKKDFYDQAKGLYRSYTSLTYDDQGELNCPGTPVCSTMVTRSYAGDISGQKYLNAEGNLVNHPASGHAEVQIDLDDQGRRLEMRYLMADGQLKPEGLAVRKFIYGPDGDTTIISLDASGAEIE